MLQIFNDGIPFEQDYRTLLESDTFREMEEFSDSFLSDKKNILQNYMKKWVDDPLHQWSRQWEYPFVYNRVQQLVQHKTRPKILDAGSGATFFPYYINSQFNETKICCCDYDEEIASVFKQINAVTGNFVEPLTADLRSLPYEKESFHMVYCISVLEHTDDYAKIIEELYRILQPGGTLVVTFDISLDGTRDIDVDKATTLLTALTNRFDNSEYIPMNLHSQLSMSGVFTTLTANDINASLLPWKLPSFLYRIKSFIATGRFGTWPPSLTVCCLSLSKCSS